jgi:plasmid segregation protein ParM
MNLPIGLDIGYNAVKAVRGKAQTTFPSVVGTADLSAFSLNTGNDVLIEHQGKTFLVGESAILQSRFVDRREDRHWFESEEYLILYFAALSALNVAGDINVITGLPVAFLADKEKLTAILSGQFDFSRNGKKYSINATVKVIPQPTGTLLDLALDNDGDVESLEIASGHVGVIDCGGKTTNLLSAYRMADISRETASVNVGGWDVIRALRTYIQNTYPNRDFRDHELAEIVRSGTFTYFGESINIQPVIQSLVVPFAQQVISQASQIWNGGASLDRIIITGGASYLLGQHVAAHFPHATVHKNPVFGNALGYYKLGVRNANK